MGVEDTPPVHIDGILQEKPEIHCSAVDMR